MTDNIFHEVDEDLRRERLQGLWQRFGSSVVALSVVVVCITVAVVFWRQHMERQAEQMGGLFIEASTLLGAEKYEEAAEAFVHIHQSTRADIAQLAALRAGEAYIAANQPEKAQEIYAQLAGNKSAAAVFRDLAVLMSVTLAQGGADEDTKTAIARLQEISAPDHPFAATAMELTAALMQRMGNKEGVSQSLQALVSNDMAPPSLRQRAQEMLSIASADAGKSHD